VYVIYISSKYIYTYIYVYIQNMIAIVGLSEETRGGGRGKENDSKYIETH
jgi:hypothetical protein